jgi:hypothetical protein
MENNNPGNGSRIHIPKRFYDSLSDTPFTNCLVCNRHLISDPTAYLIEKAFRRNPFLGKTETIFEYAICWDCIVNSQQLIRQNRGKTSMNTFMKILIFSLVKK